MRSTLRVNPMKLFGCKFKNYFDKLDAFSTLVKIVFNAETDQLQF
jgi:hypothetical protein